MQTRAALILFALSALPALAGEPAISDDALEAIATSGPSSKVTIDRSWSFNDPTRIAAPGHAIGVLRATYGSGSPTRAFAGNLGTTGGMVELGGEVGLVRGVSFMALGTQGQDGAGSSQTGGLLGLRWSVWPGAVRSTQVVVSGGYLREMRGASGAWGRVSVGHDLGATRLSAAVHGEKLFAGNRDQLDVMLTAGASTRLNQTFRAGVEYVGQDLEGVVSGEAEGGARHIVGPVVSAALWNERLAVVGGPALALGAGSQHVLGRVSLACQF